MKIVAICKTLYGHEFLPAALEGIYDNVDHIVMVHSSVSWSGRERENTVVPALDLWAEENDKKNKIKSINLNTTIQQAQYEAAIKYAEENNYDYGMLMLFDTDEVHEPETMHTSIRFMEQHPEVDVFTYQMYCYVRSPFYRVYPTQPLQPAVFIRRGVAMEGVRASDTKNRMLIPGAFFHHFCSVRNSLSAVWEKHEESCGVESEPMPEKKRWVQDVWNKAPFANNLLPLSNYEAAWKSVKQINLSDLPESVRTLPITLSFARYAYSPGRMERVQERILEKASKPARQKKTKYNLVHYEKMTGALFTIVDAAYRWYAPLFAWSAKLAYPEYKIRVGFVGTDPVGPGWGLEDEEMVQVDNFAGPGAYKTPCMRFLFSTEELQKCDWVLITDVDMLIYRETPMLHDQHIMHMEHDKTGCYENWVTEGRHPAVRMPGVHFVTKEWWKKTEEQREAEAGKLQATSGVEYNYDEYMLGRLVVNSGLPLPPAGPKLWRHHAIHLGDYRLNMERKSFKPRPGAAEGLHMQRLMLDAGWNDLLARCQEKMGGDFLVKVMKKWKVLLR